MKISDLLKQNNDDGEFLFNDKRRAIKNYKLMQWAKVATFGLYIVAVFMLYVADVWGIASFIEQNSNEYIALIIFSIISFVLAYFLASSKEAVYEDIAIHRSEGRQLKATQYAAMGLFLSSGILFEMFSTTNNQQHIANTAAEQSDMMKTIKNTGVNVIGDALLTDKLMQAQSRLATCKKNIGTKYKDCAESEASVAAVRESMAAASKTSQETTVKTLDSKTKNMLKIRESFDKPMFKAIGSATGTDNNSGMLMVVGVLIFIFECQHIMALFAYANALRRVKQNGAKNGISSTANNSYNIKPPSLPNSVETPLQAMKAEFRGMMDQAPVKIANEFARAQQAREQVYQKAADKLDGVQDGLNNLKQEEGNQDSDMSAQPDLPDRVDLTYLTDKPDLKGKPNLTEPDLPDLPDLENRSGQVNQPNQPDPVKSDLTDRTRNSGHKRPALTAAAAVRIISAQVRSQIDAGKVRPEPRHVNIAVQVCYDQIDSMWSAPDLDLDQITADILANLTAGRAEPDLTALPPQPDLNNLTGQVGQVRSNEVRSGGADLTEIEQKLAIAEQEKVRLQEQMEADRKAAEAEKVRLQEAARKLAEAKAAEAAAKARAEAEAKARAERAAAERAKAEQAQREEAARQAAAAKAKAEAEAKERAEQEAAERGKLTEEQVNLASSVIADAIKAGQITILGFSSLAPILKSAGLPKSSDSIRVLIKLGCRKLKGQLITENPNPGNGKPEFIIIK